MYASLVRGGPNGNLKFKDHKEHLKDSDLAKYYGDRFAMFDTEDGARKFAAKHSHAYVCKIVDYRQIDIHQVWESEQYTSRFKGLEIREGSKKIEKGWLVSLVTLRRKSITH